MLDQLEAQSPDALLALIKMHAQDAREDKIDLGVGVYRTNDGATPVFRSIKAAEQRLVDTQDSKSYLGPEGDTGFVDALKPYIFGKDATMGGRLEGISFAPEHPDQASEMRKPRPGMLLDIARRAKLSLEGVPFVGESLSDIQAAQAAGARPILVRSGKGRRTESGPGLEGVPIYDDLAAYVAECLARPAQA